MTAFDDAFAAVIGVEGGYDDDPADAGNWTSGKVGIGNLRGTKFGISAAAYPQIDIATLTVDAAKALYLSDYWSAHSLDRFPAAAGLLLFDAFVNGGQPFQWLQRAVGADSDGIWGPKSAAAFSDAWKMAPAETIRRFQVEHIVYHVGLGKPQFLKGWISRDLTVLVAALDEAKFA